MILVVDDHDLVRTAVIRLLASHGYTVTGVPGGRQALEFLQTNTPRLIVLDFHMPDLDGLGVLRALRANPLLSQLPVVILSAALYQAAPTGEISSLGVQDWVVKCSERWVERLLEAAERYAR